jgi:hypothetical protein
VIDPQHCLTQLLPDLPAMRMSTSTVVQIPANSRYSFTAGALFTCSIKTRFKTFPVGECGNQFLHTSQSPRPSQKP